MVDTRTQRLAEIAMGYSVDAKPGEEVGIQAPAVATPLLLELYAECLKRGAYPRVMTRLDGQEELFFSLANEDQLAHVSPFTEYEIKNLDKLISVESSANLKSLSGVDPEKQAKRSAAWAPLFSVFMKRFASQVGRYLVLPFPTNAMAQEAEMGLREYEDFTYSACGVNEADPIEFWKRRSKKQEEIVGVLDHTDSLRIVGQDTDLSLSTSGRTWENCDGHLNLPDGEICTSPLEESLEGTIRFSYPGIFMGKEIEDISLTFSKGVVKKATAAKGEGLLKELLSIDDGAKMAGEFAIGTNDAIKRFTKNMLFDEKLGHTIHLALGSAIPLCGGTNRSGIHWDILKDMREGGKILADGELIYEDGVFLV